MHINVPYTCIVRGVLVTFKTQCRSIARLNKRLFRLHSKCKCTRRLQTLLFQQLTKCQFSFPDNKYSWLNIYAFNYISSFFQLCSFFIKHLIKHSNNLYWFNTKTGHHFGQGKTNMIMMKLIELTTFHILRSVYCYIVYHLQYSSGCHTKTFFQMQTLKLFTLLFQ